MVTDIRCLNAGEAEGHKAHGGNGETLTYLMPNT